MLITIADRYCWLGKASSCNVEELDILLRELETRWMLCGCDTLSMLAEPCSQLVARVLQVIPSKPGLEISMDLLAADPVSFEELFFRSQSGQSLISEHHRFEPKLKRLELKKGEAVTPQHLPFPTSGNMADDQLASLINSFQHPALVTWIWQNLSLDRVDRILFCLKELSVPESDRLTAYVAELALAREPNLMSIEEAEKAFDMMADFIGTGDLKDGWQKSGA